MKPALIYFACACFLLTNRPSSGATYHLTDLGPVATVSAINNQGQVVGSAIFGGETHGFSWTQAGGMHDLGVLNSTHHYSRANGINDSGTIVGQSSIDDMTNASSARPIKYSGGAMTTVGTLGGQYGFANAVNATGVIVGLTKLQSTNITHAFSYDTSFHDLGSFGGGGDYSDAYAVNNAGQVVGVSTLGSTDRGFLWQNGSLTDLGGLLAGYDPTRAYEINNLGQIVGESGVAGGFSHAFLWQNGNMQDLGLLADGSNSSYAIGINDQGNVVGKSYGPSTGRAFIWTNAGGMRDLNTMLDASGNGWSLLEAHDMNNSGQIVGVGGVGNELHAYLLTPLPEPSTLVLAALGAISLLLFRVRRRKC